MAGPLGLVLIVLGLLWLVSRAIFRWMEVRNQLRVWGTDYEDESHHDPPP